MQRTTTRAIYNKTRAKKQKTKNKKAKLAVRIILILPQYIVTSLHHCFGPVTACMSTCMSKNDSMKAEASVYELEVDDEISFMKHEPVMPLTTTAATRLPFQAVVIGTL